MPKRHGSVTDRLVEKASEHGTLLQADREAVRSLPYVTRTIDLEQDIVRQGDAPDAAVFVESGMVARYHTLASGDRQYLTMHITGDMPDVQSLFLKVMDHSLCAMDVATVALFPHDALRRVFVARPGVAFAFWRLTLVDAAIFRQAITNNSARDPAGRLAHFCCERFLLAREAGLTEGKTCDLPLTQLQIGQTLGMSHISVNRALQKLRRSQLMDLRAGKLDVLDWPGLRKIAEFDPTYLHLGKDSDTSRMTFKSR
jgi:CRP-like cAMP-binding protein